jgi:hypothetical protein
LNGCLRWLAALLLFYAAGVTTALMLPLGDPPRNPAEADYHRSAIEMRHYINDHPIPALLTRLLVYRISVSDLRNVPRSCDGGSSGGLPHYVDVVATVTDHGIFGLPLRRYAASCAGNAISRGRPDYRSPALPPKVRRSDGPPPPPPPPPPVR